jgi:hypothetical protein
MLFMRIVNMQAVPSLITSLDVYIQFPPSKRWIKTIHMPTRPETRTFFIRDVDGTIDSSLANGIEIRLAPPLEIILENVLSPRVPAQGWWCLNIPEDYETKDSDLVRFRANGRDATGLLFDVVIPDTPKGLKESLQAAQIAVLPGKKDLRGFRRQFYDTDRRP